jgi:hypothetical protein
MGGREKDVTILQNLISWFKLQSGGYCLADKHPFFHTVTLKPAILSPEKS